MSITLKIRVLKVVKHWGINCVNKFKFVFVLQFELDKKKLTLSEIAVSIKQVVLQKIQANLIDFILL